MAVLIKPDGEPNGTGFFVTSEGYILTCYHVIRPAIRESSIIHIETQQGPLEAELIEDLSSGDDSLDFAILKVQSQGQADHKFPCLPLGTEVGQGDPWCTLGFELTEQFRGVPNDGTIKGYATHRDDRHLRDVILKSDNPILGGLSGSPVCNKRTGRVVGVIKEEMVHTQGHATSIEAVFRIWPQLEQLNNQSELLIRVREQKDISAKKGIHIPYSRNANFTGRDALLAALRAALASGDKVALTHVKALTGLGGIGKTQLALEYSYRYQDEYDIVWWLRSEQPSTLLDDYALMATSLKLPGWDTGDPNLLAVAARSFLEAHSRWLLVFDNAQDPQSIKPHLPHGGGGHVILTSRNPNWGNMARALEVSKFERLESIEFLLKRTGQQDQKAAEKLADALTDLPLALEQAGAYMEATGKPLDEYLKAFQERKLKLLAKARPSDYPDKVATTWDISFRAVQVACPAASDLLRLFSYLAPDEIPLQYLVEGSEMLLVARVLSDEDERDEALAMLRRYSLISRSGDKISVHRLVQAVTRDRMGKDDQKKWAEEAFKLVDGVFPYDPDDDRTWDVCSALLPHAMASADYAENMGVAINGHLLNQIGLYLKSRAESLGSMSAMYAFGKSPEIDEETLGPDHPDVARALDNLGLDHFQGDLDGAKKYIVNNMRLVLRVQDDLKGAKKYIERALKIDEQVYGLDHPSVARDVNNLGMVLKDLGELAKARECFERALKTFREKLGEDHPNTRIVANNLNSIGRN